MRALAVSFIAGVAFLLALAWAAAEPRERAATGEGTFVTLTIDNDLFAGFDHHYTNGVQFAFSANTTSVPEPIRSLPPIRWSAEPRFTFAIGQRIYTPTDKERADPDPLDRPYGGWLYALADVRTRTDTAVDSVQASVGIIGPASLAEQTQDSYHRLIGSDPARGWDAQLDNELGLLLGYERVWPSLLRAPLEPFEVDFTPRVGATLGNVFSYANTGMVVRLGQNLPDDFPVTHISLGPPRDGYRPNGMRFGWYVWFGTDARLVGWNAFLDGNMFGNGPSVDRKPFGYDLQVGVTALWKKARIGFALVRRSKEFETQPDADEFGQLVASFAF